MSSLCNSVAAASRSPSVSPCSTFAWTRLGRRYYRARVLRREDPRGVPYYWIGGAHAEVDGDPGSDAATVAGDVFSLTALRLDWSADLAGTPPWRLDGYTAVDAEEIARGAR